MDNRHILVVDDDPGLRELLQRYLAEQGYRVDTVADGVAMEQHLAKQKVNLVILDLMLPGEDGLTLARRLRAGGGPPIIMLSARGEDIDRIIGLEVGADDYLAKPFSPRELAARVKALLRRAAAQAPAPVARATPFHDDRAGQRMVLHGQLLALTRREYRLLACLLAGAGRIHARDALLAAAWGDESDSQDRTVDTHIKTLRAKLREADPARDYISTHRGMGYSLDV
jgi:two-component system catabolic regulation response regulator CreB